MRFIFPKIYFHDIKINFCNIYNFFNFLFVFSKFKNTKSTPEIILYFIRYQFPEIKIEIEKLFDAPFRHRELILMYYCECEWPPPIYLHDYLEHVFKIWHGLSTNVKKKVFLCQKFLPTPRNPPMARNFCHGEKFLG